MLIIVTSEVSPANHRSRYESSGSHGHKHKQHNRSRSSSEQRNRFREERNRSNRSRSRSRSAQQRHRSRSRSRSREQNQRHRSWSRSSKQDSRPRGRTQHQEDRQQPKRSRSRNSGGADTTHSGKPGGNPAVWTPVEVGRFLVHEHFSWSIVNKFKQHNVCGANLLDMSDTQLLQMFGMDEMNIKHYRHAINGAKHD